MNPDPSLFVSPTNPTGHSDVTGKTILQKMAQLVNGFVDGVLTLVGVNADEGHFAKKVCVGSACVDEATFLKIVNQANVGGGSSGGGINGNGGNTTGTTTSGNGNTNGTTTSPTPNSGTGSGGGRCNGDYYSKRRERTERRCRNEYR